ncbi:MAG: DUF5667 domain-containing protein [Candidatus Peregrinibacteria bacterium]|nr:DUF5667 domain-containing protein [Candidatus Peregrinibacteria bacterium]
MENNNHEQLEKILNSISQDAKPDKNFEQMLKVKLRERFYTQYETPKVPFFKRIWRLKTQLVATFILVAFSSTTIYAYGSDSVTNGSILYPLKRTTENVEASFATTPQAKTNYYNKMAKRRMRELAVLEKRGISDELTIKETNDLIVKASTIALEIPDEVDGSIETDIDTKVIEKAAPIQLAIPAKSNINLAADQTPVAAEVIEKPHRKTKREKAMEESSQVRAEFEDKFYKRTKQPIIEIKPPLEIKEPKREERKTEELITPTIEQQREVRRELQNALEQAQTKTLERTDIGR